MSGCYATLKKITSLSCRFTSTLFKYIFLPFLFHFIFTLLLRHKWSWTENEDENAPITLKSYLDVDAADSISFEIVFSLFRWMHHFHSVISVKLFEMWTVVVVSRNSPAEKEKKRWFKSNEETELQIIPLKIFTVIFSREVDSEVRDDAIHKYGSNSIDNSEWNDEHCVCAHTSL